MRASLLAINIPESYKGGSGGSGGEGKGGKRAAPDRILSRVRLYARFLWIFFIVGLFR